MKKIEIGPHVSFKSPNYLIGSINTLVKYKATAGGIFVGSPRSKQRKPIIMSQVKKAHETAKQEGFNLDNIIVHAPYIANIANGKRFDRTVFLRDVKRTNKLGLKYFNVHAGSNENLEMGIANVSNAINYIIENSDDVVILIETSVKKGNNIGSDFKEIKSIIKNVDNKSRVGVCMDTCHIWDAGYDIKNNLNGVIEIFKKQIGIRYLKAIHLNDSKNSLGSNKDRHENIGKGKIGTKALVNFSNHPNIIGKPIVLETPWINGKPDWKREMKKIKNS